MGNPKTQKEILDAIDIIVSKRMNNIAKILFGTVTGLGEQNFCTININGVTHKIRYYGNVLPDNNKKYPVFIPSSGMSQAFIITGVSTGGSGGGSSGDGVVFIPSISTGGVLSRTNNGGLPNPTPINIKGANGATFTPSVSESGIISWTNNGGLPNPAPVNIKGPQGDNYVLTEADKEEIASMVPSGGGANNVPSATERPSNLPAFSLWFDTDDTYAPNGSTSVLDLVYPVGSIYMSVSSTNPATLFGGTWEALEDRFLIGAGDTYTAGATGGEATHKLTVEEMPSHNHDLKKHEGYSMFNADSSGGSYVHDNQFMLAAKRDIGGISGVNNVLNESNLLTEQALVATGGSQAHNNMPPYLAVYMWKRTA